MKNDIIKNKIFCIFSDHRAFKSKSPKMHTNILQKAGINGVYVPFMIEKNNIGDAVKGMRALNIVGANITVPYKEDVLPHLDSHSEEVQEIGAVNTIVNDSGILRAYNTDASGFMDVVNNSSCDPKGKKAVVFGTGGAAKAILYALNKLGANVILAGRNQEKTTQLAEKMKAEPVLISSLENKNLDAGIIVNASSVSSPDESPELSSLIGTINVNNCEIIIDINYGREKNFWKDLAARLESDFIDGLPMLAAQARHSFYLWTGVDIPLEDFIEQLQG